MSFWEGAGLPASEVRARLAAARAKDVPFASGRVLGSMCTEPHPLAVEAYATFLETNLGDPALVPGARALEAEALGLLGDLLHAPPGAKGAFVSGGSEANFTALRMAAKRTGRREVVLPEHAHFSFDKTLDYLGLRPRIARLTPEWRSDVDDLRTLVGRQTACVVAVAGTTEHGVVDPIPEIAAVCRDAGVPLHVDAAYGGFVIPFLRRAGADLPAFDFEVPGVSSITIDPHKMGRAPIPGGAVLARDPEDLERIGVPSPYVSVERQPTIQGTRPGAAAAAAWAAMAHLGPDGYARQAEACLAVAKDFARRLERMGVALAREPELPIVAFRVQDPPLVRGLLRDRGYLLSLAPLSRGLKVVSMPHVTPEAIERFVPVLEETLRKTGDL